MNTMFRYLILFVGLSTIFSCGLTDDFDQTASFLRINDVNLTTKAGEGADTENFVDVWVYANGDLIGLFTPPTTVPILSETENVDFLIFAGIRNNGENTAPYVYPMISSDIFTIAMTPGETVERNLEFEYTDDATFELVEGFEENITIDVDTDGDDETNIVKSDEESASGLFSGKMVFTEEHPEMEVTTQFSFLTDNILGTAYVELDYKSETDILMGITAKSGITEGNIDHVVIPARAEWNKIYIDLTLLLREARVDEFKIYIRGVYDDETVESQKVYLDNLKYVYF